MSTLKQTLQSHLTDAIRARDAVRAGTLRMALTAVTTAEVSGNAARELSDDEVLSVLTKEGKKRREAAEAYRAAGRGELADKEDAELAVLSTYLPTELTEDEIATIVASAVASVGGAGMSAMGAVMKVIQPQVAGRADGGRVAALVREALGHA